MKLFVREDRPAKYGVHYKDVASGKYVRRFFHTVEERKEFVKAVQLESVDDFNAFE